MVLDCFPVHIIKTILRDFLFEENSCFPLNSSIKTKNVKYLQYIAVLLRCVFFCFSGNSTFFFPN